MGNKYSAATSLVFSGTSYLGINHHLGFKQRIQEGLDIYGNNYGGSRNGNTSPAVFKEAECFLSKWLGTPGSVLLSSGTLAATFLKQLILIDYQCFFEPDIHPSTHIQAMGHKKASNEKFQKYVHSTIQLDLSKKYAICLNSIDPLYLNEKKFEWLNDLPTNAEILIAIDDSHGIGVLGQNGAGIIDHISQLGLKNYVIYGSLGKALGTPAGFVTSNLPSIVEKITDSSIFAGASPPLPAYIFAFLKSQKIFEQQLHLLQENIAFFVEQLPYEHSLRWLKDYPVFFSSEEKLGERLNQHQIQISSFPYPLKSGPLLNRIVLNAGHSKKAIQRLLGKLK